MAQQASSSRETDEGRKTKIRVQKLDDLVSAARELGRRSVAVAGAEDREVLLAVRDAVESEFASAILVGDQSRITAVAKQVGIDLDSIGVEIVDIPHREGWGVEVARKTVELITGGKATVLVKGKLDTGELLRAVLDRDAGLRSGSLLTHVGLFDVPGLDRILYISDGGVVLNPTLRQKLQITRNAVDVAHTLGLAMPKVAILAAAEMVNEEMPTTVDAAALSKMADRGQITGALVDGPFGLDNAISAAAADTKGLRGPVAGRADILIVPSVEAGNLMAKVITFLSGGRMAGIVVGARVPIVITSRADPHQGKLFSIALGAILAAERAGQA